MDTRQLAAFCAVVERRSFSQAAERLGVTQPAVSLQVRALEKRLGTQFLDRSGRRVEPTEAGLRLYRGAQRLLAFEGQLLDEMLGEAEAPLAGARDRRLDRAGSIVLPLCSASSSATTRRACRAVGPTRSRSWSSSPTGGSSSDRRRRPAAPLGRVRALLPRRGDSRLPAGHPFAGKTIDLDDLSRGPLIVMQQGAGVRQMVEDELRKSGASSATSSAARARAPGVGAHGRAGGLRRPLHLALAR